jgi:hypothetical protein
MSRTDKTRPYAVKLAEATAADPYGARHEFFELHNTELKGCPHSCWQCRGSHRDARRRQRREGKRNLREEV